MKKLKKSIIIRNFTYVMFSAILQLIVPASVAQTKGVPDVDSLGDIWVVTIDNTYSMLHPIVKMGNEAKYTNLTPLDIANSIGFRLSKAKCLDSVVWSKDKFLFFTSGMREGTMNYMASQKHLDTSFIHATDDILHSFANKKAFVNHLKNQMLDLSYEKNYMSFVSMMRLMSLKRALDWLTANGEINNYRIFRLMTISDDATDQYDQWNTDYRKLKLANPREVDYVSAQSIRLLYNPLQSRGGGDVSLVWKSDTVVPHIWIYDYITMQGRRVMDTSDVYVNVAAKDGKKINFEVIDGDKCPCLYWIDSVIINGKNIAIESYFTDGFNKAADYKNGLFRNDITVYGKAQIEYTDSILGAHYRVVDFVQKSQSMPRHLAVILNAVALIAFIGVVAFLLYWLLFLPRKVLFDIYDSSGRRHRVRRGYRRQWQGDIIPILTLFIDSRNNKTTALSKQDSKVENKEVTNPFEDDECDRVLIASRYKLVVSENVICPNDVTDDLESYYKVEVDYPPLLKKIYRSSSVYKYYKMRNSFKPINKVVGGILLSFRRILYGTKRYYYYRQSENAVSVESSALRGKLFLVEIGKLTQGCYQNNYRTFLNGKGEFFIRQSLVEYFNSTKKCTKKDNGNIVLLLSRYDNCRAWDVVQTNVSRNGKLSFCNTNWIYHYAIPETIALNVNWEYKTLKRYIRKTFHKKIAFFDCGELNDNSVNLAIGCFNLTHSYSKQFLSLVTSENEYTLLYDPLRDGTTSSKQIMIQEGTYNLHFSFLPAKFLKRKMNNQYCKKISDKIIPFASKRQAVSLEIISEKHYRIHGLDISI